MTQKYRFGSRVLIVDENGSKLGEMPVSAAKSLAFEQGLDLVEMNRQGDLSICRIMDEGKWKYEQKKKLKAARQHTPDLKEVKFSMRIDPHDEQVKVEHARKFLEKGDLVRIVVEMRGREKGKRFLADEKLNHILTLLGSGFKIESQKGNPSDISVLVRPVKKNEQSEIQRQTSVSGHPRGPQEVSSNTH